MHVCSDANNEFFQYVSVHSSMFQFLLSQTFFLCKVMCLLYKFPFISTMYLLVVKLCFSLEQAMSEIHQSRLNQIVVCKRQSERAMDGQCSCPRGWFLSLQTCSPYRLFQDLLSNGARSKARGRAREKEPPMVLVRFEYLCSDSESKLLIDQFNLTHVKYYHLHSTVKREHFVAHVYFSNKAWCHVTSGRWRC